MSSSYWDARSGVRPRDSWARAQSFAEYAMSSATLCRRSSVLRGLFGLLMSFMFLAMLKPFLRESSAYRGRVCLSCLIHPLMRN